MNVVLFHGYPDRVGKRSIWCGVGTGPKSFTSGSSPTDTITGLPFQFYIDSISEISISVSGTYYAIAQPSVIPTPPAGQASVVNPRPTWFVRYYVAATGAEQTNIDLSAEKFIVSGTGGFY